MSRPAVHSGPEHATEFATEAPVDPLLGQHVGRFRLTARLGSGAYGVVYRGEHSETGGAVAVKILRADLVADPNAMKRFSTEATHTHRLHHPNTVRMVDFGTAVEGTVLDGRPYMVTEFIDGRPLRDLIDVEAPLGVDRALRIAEQVLKSLGEAHAHGLVHRDLKPSNVMLVDQFGEPDFVKVLDFGIARSVDSAGNSTAGPIGTPRYMAPEQWLAMPVDGRADLYALGVMLFEMWTGHLPFDVTSTGSLETAVAWMNAHVHEPPRSLARVSTSDWPKELEALISTLLAKSPGDRPADVASVLGWLKRVRTSRDVSQGPRSAPPTVEAVPAPPTRRGGLGWGLGALLVLAAGAVGAWQWAGSGSEGATPNDAVSPGAAPIAVAGSAEASVSAEVEPLPGSPAAALPIAADPPAASVNAIVKGPAVEPPERRPGLSVVRQMRRGAALAPAPVSRTARPASARSPRVAKPAIAKPAVSKPAIAKPAVSKPAVSKPRTAKPTVNEPQIDKPRVATPTIESPTATLNQPTAPSKPTRQLPTLRLPTGGSKSNEASPP